jgi:pyroglutamyl-peptidase
MPQRTFITGFLAFGDVVENPSALLAQSLGRRFELLEVTYAAVDAFVERVAREQNDIERLLMLGVRRRGSGVDLERRARNEIGALPDARGEIRGPGPIAPDGPAEVMTTLFHPSVAPSFSDDAGCYLCNYAYYRALRRLPEKRVGFVHVPPVEVMPLDAQRQVLVELLRTLESS